MIIKTSVESNLEIGDKSIEEIVSSIEDEEKTESTEKADEECTSEG